LAKEYEEGHVTDEAIKTTAVHECLELLLSPLEALAMDRGWDEIDWDKERHIVIRTLEKIIGGKHAR